MRRLLTTLIALMPLLAVSWAEQPATAQDQPSEYQVKAAFLYHFAEFTEWPAGAFDSPGSPFVIGILGPDPFGKDLERTIGGKEIRNHPIRLLRLGSLDDASQCHIVFVSRSSGADSNTHRLLERAGILSIGEAPDFLKAGGMIRLQMRENKVRFAVNAVAAERAGLRISSKLLRLGLKVED